MDNSEYQVYEAITDFQYIDEDIPLTGRRTKKLVEFNGQKAILKFPPKKYPTSEVASEKIAYELAEILSFPCARTELAQDEDG